MASEITAAQAADAPAGPPIDKVIIAIHGIGSQRRSDTIRSVARRFGDRSDPPLPVMPLGFFQIGKVGDVHVSRLDAPDDSPLRRIGFAEVFWADIPRKVVKEDDTLEETKAWGASVVSRAQATYTQKVTNKPELRDEDFKLAAGVVDEIVETVAVLENLLAVAGKMGLFQFELAPLLRDYIGDVQLVADFSFYRQKIVARFHSAMAQIVEQFFSQYPEGTPEVYIVAHSEGTVVSFIGLLEALSENSVSDPETMSEKISTDWIRFVRGFMTIGSPIDKHLVLWPKIWEGLQLDSRRDGSAVLFERDGKERLRLACPIQWRNYYDFGDPIGFQLETAVGFLADQKCKAFDFVTDKHDFGFSRYWLPGKAHNDYWRDPQVFGHFIDDVVMRPAQPPVPPPKPPVPPKSSRLIGIVSTAIPYLLVLVLHFAAILVLYKAVTAFLGPGNSSDPEAFAQTSRVVALLALMLAGVTSAARLPRLVKTAGWRWHVLALSGFLAAAAPSLPWLPPEVAKPLSPLLLLVAAALVAVVSGWIVPRRPRWGRRTLIGFGMVLTSVIVVRRVIEADVHRPVWPVALAGLAFLYLWWLGILLFDLAFVWHRYIRNSVAVRTLRQWHRGRDARPDVTLRGRTRATPAATT